MYGVQTMPLIFFIGWLVNTGITIGLITYMFTHNKVQNGGYMEVSNYSNLNKLK
jgi:hypothetical protein